MKAISMIVALAALAAPTDLTLVPGDSQLEASWTSVSGAASYTVQATPVGSMFSSASSRQATTSVGTSLTLPGLTNGTTYRVRVRANNDDGSAGGFSAVVTGTPEAPEDTPDSDDTQEPEPTDDEPTDDESDDGESDDGESDDDESDDEPVPVPALPLFGSLLLAVLLMLARLRVS